jgi:hypothetical protein
MPNPNSTNATTIRAGTIHAQVRSGIRPRWGAGPAQDDPQLDRDEHEDDACQQGGQWRQPEPLGQGRKHDDGDREEGARG